MAVSISSSVKRKSGAVLCLVVITSFGEMKKGGPEHPGWDALARLFFLLSVRLIFMFGRTLPTGVFLLHRRAGLPLVPQLLPQRVHSDGDASTVRIHDDVGGGDGTGGHQQGQLRRQPRSWAENCLVGCHMAFHIRQIVIHLLQGLCRRCSSFAGPGYCRIQQLLRVALSEVGRIELRFLSVFPHGTDGQGTDRTGAFRCGQENKVLPAR